MRTARPGGEPLEGGLRTLRRCFLVDYKCELRLSSTCVGALLPRRSQLQAQLQARAEGAPCWRTRRRKNGGLKPDDARYRHPYRADPPPSSVRVAATAPVTVALVALGVPRLAAESSGATHAAAAARRAAGRRQRHNASVLARDRLAPQPVPPGGRRRARHVPLSHRRPSALARPARSLQLRPVEGGGSDGGAPDGGGAACSCVPTARRRQLWPRAPGCGGRGGRPSEPRHHGRAARLQP